MINKVIGFLTVLLLLAFTGCKNEVLPKPAGQLRLDYEVSQYVTFSNQCPFTFEMNEKTTIKANQNCEFTINYPKMKATIYLTYKTVNNDIDKLLRDAQKLTYEHVIKADDILEQPYINKEKKVYGMFYSVSGNAATNAQFYATDSIKHFVTGSVYFYAKPNFDSIMPAADYIKNDMQHLIESIQWDRDR
ncbi:gliding motility lipoprotein GldD [Flavobacterium sp.]|jgi:gliding motility-associated lipoprotein GldD|uniref:gliding motility lipoprotein GldD n=1 Tax=Flavobacterium sp. TaxID=239 RepID=UPI0037C00469